VNLPQRIVLIGGAFVTLVICLFPPWQYAYYRQTASKSFDFEHYGPATTYKAERDAGFHFIFGSVGPSSPPDLADTDYDNPDNFKSIRIDIKRLSAELAGILVATSMFCLGFARRQS